MPDDTRIDGDFHYALFGGGEWIVYRASDNHAVDADKNEQGAANAVSNHDEQARHFLTLGAEQKERELNEAAAKLLDDGRFLTLERTASGQPILTQYQHEGGPLVQCHSRDTFTEALLSTKGEGR